MKKFLAFIVLSSLITFAAVALANSNAEVSVIPAGSGAQSSPEVL